MIFNLYNFKLTLFHFFLAPFLLPPPAAPADPVSNIKV